MRKAILILAIVLILVSLAIVPAMAGRGDPQIERGGEQVGQAKQQGPSGPNYGGETLTEEETETGGALVYRAFLPLVSKCVNDSVQVGGRVSVSWE